MQGSGPKKMRGRKRAKGEGGLTIDIRHAFSILKDTSNGVGTIRRQYEYKSGYLCGDSNGIRFKRLSKERA